MMHGNLSMPADLCKMKEMLQLLHKKVSGDNGGHYRET